MFAYCDNNPINRHAPNGTDWYGLRTGHNYGDVLTAAVRYRMEVDEGGIKNCCYISSENSIIFGGSIHIGNYEIQIHSANTNTKTQKHRQYRDKIMNDR